MNTKRFVFAGLAVFIAGFIMDWIIHGIILKGAYESLISIWRPEEEMNSMMWIWYVGSLIFSFLFVYIFTKGYENKGIMEGVRYGLLIGLLMVLFGNLAQYAMYPLPFSLVWKWFVFGMIEFIIFGIITAAIYKPAKK